MSTVVESPTALESLAMRHDQEKREARQAIWREFEIFLSELPLLSPSRLWFWWDAQLEKSQWSISRKSSPPNTQLKVFIDIHEGDCSELIRFKFYRAFEKQCPQLCEEI